MTTDQLIAALFPVGTVLAAAGTVWFSLRFIAPRPTEQAPSPLYKPELNQNMPSELQIYSPAVKSMSGGATLDKRDLDKRVSQLSRAREAIHIAEHAIDELIQTSNGGNF